MKSLIAFNSESQAYVLPITTTTIGAVVVSQPKFISNSLAKGIARIRESLVPDSWVSDCQNSNLLSNAGSRQKIYCWWMSLSSEEKEQIYNESIV